MIEELERMFQTVRRLAWAIPLLLVIGLGLGSAAYHGLTLDGPAFIVGPRTDTDTLAARAKVASRTILEGRATEAWVERYQRDVRPVEGVLLRRGVDAALARRVAWPLLEEAERKGLDPATVLAVVLIESNGRPDAESFVGARGLMQVMPAHEGRWRECTGDLYDIEANLCYGTSILKDMLDRYPGERRALLAYNGCRRGTNTPNCHTYPDKIARLRGDIAGWWGENSRAQTVSGGLR